METLVIYSWVSQDIVPVLYKSTIPLRKPHRVNCSLGAFLWKTIHAGLPFFRGTYHYLLKQIKVLILHGSNGATIRKQKGRGRRQGTQEGGKDGISILQVSHERRLSGSLKQMDEWLQMDPSD